MKIKFNFGNKQRMSAYIEVAKKQVTLLWMNHADGPGLITEIVPIDVFWEKAARFWDKTVSEPEIEDLVTAC